MSLSARRAWIEMCDLTTLCCCASVALRKESVDRNRAALARPCVAAESLSARRAWIEITVMELIPLTDSGRSPQGERG